MQTIGYWQMVIKGSQVPFDYEVEVQKLKKEQEKLEIINGIRPRPAL